MDESAAKRLFGVYEAAWYLGVSDWTIKRMLRDGELASLKINDRRLIPREELDAFIERGLAADRAERGVA